MKVQQDAYKALELARVCQTRVSQDHLKPAPPLVHGQDTVLVHSALYLKALGKQAKITLPCIGLFPVLEGPHNNNNNNYKVEFGSLMSSVHPWVARSQLKPYLFPDEFMYPSECFPRSGHIEVKEEAWVVEKIVDDRKKNRCHQFLVH
jgi:hypothetical protein